ncbi:DUF4340 domain-containing protein [Candidatus Rariloculus sp.]|uniref:DUF4340 domain-containing protein n=1 Tax=Candidatus Rariloculus sp. TaxID=3101265 RepID=UPI003D0E1D04
MNRRALMTIATLAVVLVVLAMFGQGRSTSPSLSGAVLLPGLGAVLNDIDEITLVRAGNETIASLRRSEQGWTVPEKGGYPADVAKIREALLALSEARVMEEKTSNPEFYDRLGVEPVESASAAGTAVTIRHGDETFSTVILGDVEGTGYRYARRADEALGLLIDRDPELPRSAPQWLVTGILDLRADRIREVTIDHADGERVRIFKDDAGQTNYSVEAVPDGRELQYPGVANVIGNVLRELALEDVERAPDDESVPSVTTAFRTFDGLVVTARGSERDGQNWIEFEAAFDAEPGAEPAAEPVQDEPGQDDPGEAADEDQGLDARAEAEAIDSTVAGWRYQIPSYKYEQMTRRMEDLLNPAE